MSFETAVDRALGERRRFNDGRSARPGLAAAAALHLAIVAVAIFGARRQPAPPLEFLAVEIIPAQRLGIERPPEPAPAEPSPPAPASVRPPEPIQPKPRPAVPPPSPAPKPAPGAAPAPEAPAAPAAPAAPQGSTEGSASGTSSLGATVSRVDDPTFTYGYYVDQMLGLVRAQWVRPPLGGGIECVLHFRVRRDGRVQDLRILTSSGYASFDLAARRAVESASPLPPLPRGYRGDNLGVTLVVR